MSTVLMNQLRGSLEAIDRRGFLGGSDMAAILGLSPWKTPYQLYLEKTSDYVPETDLQKQKLFRRGHLLEPVVVQMVREEYDLEITASNQRYYDKEFPFLSCEIDFEYMDTDGIQNADVKTVNLGAVSQWGAPGTDDIPVYYTVQFLFGQMITGRERTLCPALIGNDLRLYRVLRDEDAIAHLRAKAVAFWELVEKRTPPPLTSLADVDLAWPRDAGRVVEATAEIAALIEQHKLLRRSSAGDDAKCELLEIEIFKFMGDASEIVSPEGKKLATRKWQERKGYSVAPASFRVFRAA